MSYNSANHAAAQAGALISAAEGKLSHTPETTAKCFSGIGYSGTSRSNLALGGAGAKAIDLYINDFGDNNTFVGHRRWILSPALRGIATGDIPEDSNGSSWGANALYVFDTGNPLPTRDGAIAWPPPGFVPDKVVYGRWSYVRLGANFANAQVTVTGPNGVVATDVQSRSDFMGPGIVFTPKIAANRSADITYTVTITGVTGAPSESISYNVIIVPINYAPTIDSVEVGGDRCSGRDTFLMPYFNDPEDDTIKVEFADRSGDAALFTLSRGVSRRFFNMTPKVSLDPSRESYTFTFRATDASGAARTVTTTVNIRWPGPKTLCQPRDLSIKRNRKGALVTLTTVSLGATPTKFIARDGSRNCFTTGNSCVIKGLTKGRHMVTVTAMRKGSRPVTTSRRFDL